MSILRFDDAWLAANDFVRRRLGEWAAHVVVVRDIYGRVRIVLDDRASAVIGPSADERGALAKELQAQLGAWSPGEHGVLALASSMFAPDDLLSSDDLLAADSQDATMHHRVLERGLVGADWYRPAFAAPRVPRLALHGIKGGVGRSTAAAVLAWRLSQRGRRVLLVDLDLESPGVGTTLLPDEAAPDFGVVDWFVEDALGQADDRLVRDMLALSPLSDRAELLVAPAGGRTRDGYAYLPKLARAYADVARPAAGAALTSHSFADRLHRLVCQLEQAARPAVTILDSRAGLHDIAAVAVTRLGATSLLFAVDSPQTWHAYGELFRTWRQHADRAALFRENLKLVAALVPETNTARYLQSVRAHAYDLFAENLYVAASPGELGDFNFDLADSDAPHAPLRIHWSRTFQQFDPVRQPDALTEEQIQAAFGDFVEGTAQLLFGGRQA